MGQLSGYNQPVVTDESLTCGFDTLLAVCRERNIGSTGVAAVETPFSFAVANDEHARRHNVWLRRCKKLQSSRVQAREKVLQQKLSKNR